MTKKEKICVYTCITGNYDNLKEIPNIENGIDYYCFTNNKKIKSNTWKVIYIEDDKLSNVQLARKTKILGNDIVNSYDIALWMDGAVIFNKPIIEFINYYLKESDVFVAFKHGERNSIKDEAYACYRFNKETKDNINKLLKFLEKEKYEDNNGLIESTVYIKRPKDKLVKETMKMWFDMIVKYTKRDQLSFNYCISKTGLSVKWINEKVFDNEWFSWKKHFSESKIENYNIYFGDIDNYDIDKDIKGHYKINGNNYSFSEEVVCATDKIYITVCNVNCVNYSNLKINNLKTNQYKIYNALNYNGKDIIYTNEFVIEINKKYKAKDKINFSIDMLLLDKDQQEELIKKLGDTSIILSQKINDLEREIDSKSKYIEKLWSTINSSLLCRIGLKLKRRKDI